jgi:hypothetical protein
MKHDMPILYKLQRLCVVSAWGGARLSMRAGWRQESRRMDREGAGRKRRMSDGEMSDGREPGSIGAAMR